MVEFDWLTGLDGFDGVLSLLILVDHLLRSTQLSQCLWKKQTQKTKPQLILNVNSLSELLPWQI